MSSFSKAIKNQQNIFRITKLILFIALFVVLYFQLTGIQMEAWNAFHLDHPLAIFLCILLMPLNWWYEFKKWTLTLDQLEIDEGMNQRVHSFLAGIVTGLITPNMIGNFLGRIYFFDRRHRANIVLFTLVNSHAQLLSTLIAGLAGIVMAGSVIGYANNQFISISALIIIPLMVLGYYLMDLILIRFNGNKNYLRSFAHKLRDSGNYRTKILLWSVLRYFTFVLQYLLILYAFDVPFSWDILYALMQIYLISTLFPSLFFGKLGIRESIGLVVLGTLGVNEFAIIVSSLVVWVVNLLIPALISLMICKRAVR